MSSNKNRLMGNLDNLPAQPPIKKAPTTYPLSTQTGSATAQDSDNALPQNSISAITQERIIAPTHENKNAKIEPNRVNRGYKLREDLIKSLKRIALEEDRLLYEVMEEALVEYLDRKKAG